MEQNSLNNQVEENVNEEVMEIEENAEMEANAEVQDFQEYFEEDQGDYEEELYNKKKKEPLVVVIAIMAALILILLGLLIWKAAPSKDVSKTDASQTAVSKDFKTVYDYYLVKKAEKEEKEKIYAENEAANTEKYNSLGYKNVSGDTLGDAYAMYEMQGIDFEQFLIGNGLPTDMTKDTYIEVATYLMPVSSYMETFATEFGMTKITLDSGEEVEITKDMPIGLVIDDMKVSDAIKFMMGQEDLEAFKAEYGFGEEVTAETKWKEIRAKVEDVDIEKRIAEEKAAEEAEAAEAEAVPEEGAEEPVSEEAAEVEVTEEITEEVTE